MISFLKNLIFSLPILAIYASIFMSDEIDLNIKINLFSLTFIIFLFYYFIKVFYEFIEQSDDNKIYKSLYKITLYHILIINK